MTSVTPPCVAQRVCPVSYTHLYINAFEALDQRLQDTKLEEDQKEAVSQEAQDALA